MPERASPGVATPVAFRRLPSLLESPAVARDRRQSPVRSPLATEQGRGRAEQRRRQLRESSAGVGAGESASDSSGFRARPERMCRHRRSTTHERQSTQALNAEDDDAHEEGNGNQGNAEEEREDAQSPSRK